jgi:radical SAM superfamily enzyme YgiQ (UPF0313 family)
LSSRGFGHLRLAILDSNYPKQQHQGLAATWLRWELEQAGIREYPAPLADTLLVTVSSQQGIADVKRELRKLNLTNKRIVMGGGGCYAPAVFEGLGDVICVGEGTRFMRTLLADGFDAATTLPESWTRGESCPVIPGREFPWDVPPLNHPDGTVRVFGSRGCKYRCLFCQTGWETTYRVNPDLCKLQAQIDSLERQGKRIAVVTNDAAEEQVKFTGQQEFLSVRLQNLRHMMPLTRMQVKSVRIGVEGVSERLRIAVGKPVANDELLRITFDLLANGVGVRWFFIPGLPGEIDEDYAELRYLVRELHYLPKGCVMMNFHSFIPQPATPLGVLPLVDDYWERFDEFRRWFFHGPGFTRRVQIIAPNKYPSRLRRAMESMAATETELRHGWFEHDNRNWRVQYLAQPDRLRQVAQAYAKRVGLTKANES